MKRNVYSPFIAADQLAALSAQYNLCFFSLETPTPRGLPCSPQNTKPSCSGLTRRGGTFYGKMPLVFPILDLYMLIGPVRGCFWTGFGPVAANWIARLFKIITNWQIAIKWKVVPVNKINRKHNMIWGTNSHGICLSEWFWCLKSSLLKCT